MNQKFDASAITIGNVIRTLLDREALKVTAYLSPSQTVKASRVLFGKKIDKRDKRADIRVTIGVPNYAERRVIKEFQKAGEPFPVKEFVCKMAKTA